MASIPCQFDDGQVAVFIGTNLQNGDVVTTCYEHMIEFFTNTLEAVAKAAAGEPADEIVDELTATEAVPTDEELEAAFEKWKTDNAERLLELMETGSTEQEAVALLLEHDANALSDADSDSTVTN